MASYEQGLKINPSDALLTRSANKLRPLVRQKEQMQVLFSEKNIVAIKKDPRVTAMFETGEMDQKLKQVIRRPELLLQQFDQKDTKFMGVLQVLHNANASPM